MHGEAGHGSPPAVSGVRACLCGPLPLEPGGKADLARMKLETRKASADERGFLTACEIVACAGKSEMVNDMQQDGSQNLLPSFPCGLCVFLCLSVFCLVCVFLCVFCVFCVCFPSWEEGL